MTSPFKLESVSISEHPTEDSSVVGYTAEVHLSITTTAPLIVPAGQRRVPKINLGEDSIYYVALIYSKEKKSKVFSLEQSPNTVVDILPLSQIIYNQDGTLSEDIISGTRTGANIPIKYNFFFKKNLDGLYGDTSPENLKVVAAPFTRKEAKRPSFLPKVESINIKRGLIIEGTKDLRKKYYENLFDISMAGKSSSPPTFTDLYTSYEQVDGAPKTKSMFGLDKGSILSRRSNLSFLMNRKGIRTRRGEVYRRSNIESLIIKKQKLKDNKIDLNAIKTTVVSSNETNGILNSNNRLQAGNEVAKIEQLAPTIDLNNGTYYKFIMFEDLELGNDGIYKYSIDISMKDGIRDLLLLFLDRLVKDISKIDIYYKEKYVLGNSTATPIDEANSIATLVSQLNDEAYDLGADFKDNVLNLLNYEESTLNLLIFSKTLAKNLTSMLAPPVISFEKSKNYTKTNSERSIIYENFDFQSNIDVLEAKNINYDYLGELDPNKNVGINILTGEDLANRFSFDFARLIDTSEFEIMGYDFDQLEQDLILGTFGKSVGKTYGGYFNLKENFCSYLAPIKIHDNEINLTNSFDPEVFNNIHFIEESGGDLDPLTSLGYIMSDNGISISGQFYNAADSGIKVSNSSSPSTPKYKNFDGTIDIRKNFIPMANSILKKEEEWSLSLEDYTYLSIQQDFYKGMPNHYRVLYGGVGATALKNNWRASTVDFVSNPNTYYMIKQNYTNLVSVRVVELDKKASFSTASGPRLLTLDDLSGTKSLLCYLETYNNPNSDKAGVFYKRNYKNKFFIIKPTKDLDLETILDNT
tara:strand:- start:1492 stop:3918 length:2427 start_codon:yes stop_codon:yes gene_type:complete